MPLKRQVKRNIISNKNDSSINKKIEQFASGAELQQKIITNKNDLPTVGMTIKLNEYEHNLLKNVSKARGRSMQKQIKRILIRELEKYNF